MTDDAAHMRAALALARRGLGTTWPNPSVGCVIVREGRVVGRGHTQPGGRPHAEAVALLAAGGGARGATAYVSLEPCSHHGRTPPCADALIAAGITRVVVAGTDPDPRVNGAGLARLRAAGLAVEDGLLGTEADMLQRGFLTRISAGRPMVTLKLATTLDGRIATAGGESQWITGAAARHAAHGLRASHDAVLAGIGTVLADDPALTARLPFARPLPLVRVVLDRRLRTPPGCRLFHTDGPVWIVHAPGADAARGAALTAAGATLIEAADTAAAMAALGRAGLTRVLAEGGATVAGSLLAAGLVDRLAWFHAPALLGADALPAVQGFGIRHLVDMPRFRRVQDSVWSPDLLTEYEAVVPVRPPHSLHRPAGSVR